MGCLLTYDGKAPFHPVTIVNFEQVNKVATNFLGATQCQDARALFINSSNLLRPYSSKVRQSGRFVKIVYVADYKTCTLSGASIACGLVAAPT